MVAHYLQHPDITAEVFAAKHVDVSFFSDQERAQKMFNNELDTDPLNFLSLKADTEDLGETAADDTTLMARSAKAAVENWLHAQYLEAVEAAKSAQAVYAQNDDEAALMRIMVELQSLKKKYSQR